MAAEEGAAAGSASGRGARGNGSVTQSRGMVGSPPVCTGSFEPSLCIISIYLHTAYCACHTARIYIDIGWFRCFVSVSNALFRNSGNGNF